MIRRLLVDQFLCEEEKISINAAIVFDVVLKLNNHSQIQKVKIDDKIYTVLYRNMILKQIPYFKISIRTLSNAIKELEDSNLIESKNKNTVPAYRLTSKADKYNFLPKDGEFDATLNKPQTKQKVQLLSLGKKTRLDKTTTEYKNILKEKAKEHSEKVGVEYPETFQAFVDFHIGKGNMYVNWLSAYKTWCRNALSWNKKTNDGENYYGNLMG